MPIPSPFSTKISAFLVIFGGACAPAVAAEAAPGAALLQSLALADPTWWNAAVAAAMVSFALLFGRAFIEMGGRLAPFDRALWRGVLVAGVGAGGALLIAGESHGAMLPGCAAVLAFLLAIAGWRCRAAGVAGGPVFGLAALGALAGPAWGVSQGAEVSGASAVHVATAAGIIVALTMLGVPLLLAIGLRSRAGEPAAGVRPSAVPDDDVPRGPGSDRDGLPAPANAAPAVGRASGLATSAMLRDRIERGMQRSARAEVPLAVVWIEVRSAPEVARLFGDEAGEELLAAVSRRLDEALRLESSLAKTGAQSFAAVCEAVADLDEVLAIMNKLREQLALPCELSDGAIRIDASFGHAMFPQDATDARGLCRIAARRARGAVKREVRAPLPRLLEEQGAVS